MIQDCKPYQLVQRHKNFDSEEGLICLMKHVFHLKYELSIVAIIFLNAHSSFGNVAWWYSTRVSNVQRFIWYYYWTFVLHFSIQKVGASISNAVWIQDLSWRWKKAVNGIAKNMILKKKRVDKMTDKIDINK